MADTIAKRRELELLKERVATLSNEIRSEESICKHDWSEPVYDPESRQEGVFDHYEPHGSDPEPVYRYYEVKVDRWRRTCKKCGKPEYAKEMKPTHFTPAFE